MANKYSTEWNFSLYQHYRMLNPPKGVDKIGPAGPSSWNGHCFIWDQDLQELNNRRPFELRFYDIDFSEHGGLGDVIGWHVGLFKATMQNHSELYECELKLKFHKNDEWNCLIVAVFIPMQVTVLEK